jgi:lysozyme family protein
MANLDISLKKVLVHEGANDGKLGYVNDKTDNGGETIAGISRKFHSSCDIWRLVDSAKKQPNFPYNIKLISEINNIIADFYRANFWEKIKWDAINSQDIADLLMDKAVLEGIPSAIKRAQGIAGLPQTGVIDNNLIGKLNSL